jgi:hypothetical protein
MAPWGQLSRSHSYIVVVALSLGIVTITCRVYSTDEATAQILAAEGDEAGLSQLFPDYTKLANIAAKLPDGPGKAHAFKLLRSSWLSVLSSAELTSKAQVCRARIPQVHHLQERSQSFFEASS